MQLDDAMKKPLERFGLGFPVTLRMTVTLDPIDERAAKEYGSYKRVIAAPVIGDEKKEITLRMLTKKGGVLFWDWTAEPLFSIHAAVTSGLKELVGDWKMRERLNRTRRVRG